MLHVWHLMQCNRRSSARAAGSSCCAAGGRPAYRLRCTALRCAPARACHWRSRARRCSALPHLQGRNVHATTFTRRRRAHRHMLMQVRAPAAHTTLATEQASQNHACMKPASRGLPEPTKEMEAMSGWSRMRFTVSCVPCTMLSTPLGRPGGQGRRPAKRNPNAQHKQQCAPCTMLSTTLGRPGTQDGWEQLAGLLPTASRPKPFLPPTLSLPTPTRACRPTNT